MAAQETVATVCEAGILNKDKGTIKLLQSYIVAHGDPATNNLGHRQMKTMWEDGTIRDVVCVPETAPDEMEAEWFVGNRTHHQTDLADSSELQEPSQVKDIYRRLRSAQGSKFSGEVVPRKVPLVCPLPSAAASSSGASTDATPDKPTWKRGALKQDARTSGTGCLLEDMLLDECEECTSPPSVQPLGRGASKAKTKAKAAPKQAAISNMPAPLPRAVAAKPKIGHPGRS